MSFVYGTFWLLKKTCIFSANHIDVELLTPAVHLRMAQFMFPSSSCDSLLSAPDCHYVQYSPVVSCAVQFPTPVSQNSVPPLIALAPNIDNPQWQHLAVLPTTTVNPSSNLPLASAIGGQPQWQYGCAAGWQGNDASSGNRSSGRINAATADVEFQQPTSHVVQQ